MTCGSGSDVAGFDEMLEAVSAVWTNVDRAPLQLNALEMRRCGRSPSMPPALCVPACVCARARASVCEFFRVSLCVESAYLCARGACVPVCVCVRARARDQRNNQGDA
jgi:hypothetical protein